MKLNRFYIFVIINDDAGAVMAKGVSRRCCCLLFQGRSSLVGYREDGV